VPHRGEGFDQEKSALACRRSIEQQFHCKSNEAVDPAHINAVRTDITRMRTDLDARIRKSSVNLQQIANHAVEQQRTLAAATNGPFRSWKQAQIGEVVASTSPKINSGSVKKLAAGGIVIAILVGVPFGSSNRSSPPSSNSNSSGRARSMQMTSDFARGESNYSPAGRDVSVMPPDDVVTATIQSQPSGSPPVLGARNSPISNPSKANDPMSLGLYSPEITRWRIAGAQTVDTHVSATPSAPPLDVLRIEDAARVQQRLIELGFLSGTANGIWGPRSRQALRDFRMAHGEADSDTWDEGAQQLLFSASAKQAAIIASSRADFAGGWAIDTAQCRQAESGQAPLSIDARRAQAFGGTCEFKSVQRDGYNVWRVQAVCSFDGNSWDAKIRLTLNGGRLTWTSKRGTTTYVRCSASRSASRSTGPR
jgi:peptidoglycan hydrolase-like protein with peptidoglycan-binding domain